jgi:hypothetical protein
MVTLNLLESFRFLERHGIKPIDYEISSLEDLPSYLKRWDKVVVKNYKEIHKTEKGGVLFVFNDSDLDTLVKYALDSSLDVLAMAQRVEQARYNVGYVKADMWPNFGVQANASRKEL